MYITEASKNEYLGDYAKLKAGGVRRKKPVENAVGGSNLHGRWSSLAVLDFEEARNVGDSDGR